MPARRLITALVVCLATACLTGPARAGETLAARPSPADDTAPGRPAAFAEGGFCEQAAGSDGVRAKLCRILGGLLIRMDPIPERSTVRLGKDGGVYREGEFVTVTVDVPPGLRRGYLNVVFLDESGEVLHMLPNLYARDTAVRGGQRVVLGVEEAGRRRGLRDYRVSPPYGRGMILALVSPRPLDALGRQETETMGGFLSSLETALRSTAGGGAPVRFASAAIETRGR